MCCQRNSGDEIDFRCYAVRSSDSLSLSATAGAWCWKPLRADVRLTGLHVKIIQSRFYFSTDCHSAELRMRAICDIYNLIVSSIFIHTTCGWEGGGYRVGIGLQQARVRVDARSPLQCITRRLATANKSRVSIRVTIFFGQNKGRGRPCNFFFSSSLITMQNLQWLK